MPKLSTTRMYCFQFLDTKVYNLMVPRTYPCNNALSNIGLKMELRGVTFLVGYNERLEDNVDVRVCQIYWPIIRKGLRNVQVHRQGRVVRGGWCTRILAGMMVMMMVMVVMESGGRPQDGGRGPGRGQPASSWTRLQPSSLPSAAANQTTA